MERWDNELQCGTRLWLCFKQKFQIVTSKCLCSDSDSALILLWMEKKKNSKHFRLLKCCTCSILTKPEMKALCIMPTCKDIHTPEGSLSVAHLENDSFEWSYNNSAKPQESKGNSKIFHDGLQNDGEKCSSLSPTPLKAHPLVLCFLPCFTYFWGS